MYGVLPYCFIVSNLYLGEAVGQERNLLNWMVHLKKRTTSSNLKADSDSMKLISLLFKVLSNASDIELILTMNI